MRKTEGQNHKKYRKVRVIDETRKAASPPIVPTALEATMPVELTPFLFDSLPSPLMDGRSSVSRS